MSVRGHAFRGSLTLSLGGFVSYGSSFARNMILARVLTKEDFGVAASLSLIVTLLEFSAKMGVARLVVQDKDGDRADFIASAHLVQFSAAAFGAVLILASASLLERLFDVPNLSVTISWLTLVAVFRGLEHMDLCRYQRNLRFGPATLAEVIPQLLITLAAWPVAIWLNDFRAVVALLIAKTALTSVLSHLFSERAYRWKWHKDNVFRILRFGWPLLATGFLLVGVMQGDQFLVASFYTMEDLGPYAAAASLALAPSFLFGRIFNPIALPLLAKVQDDLPVLQQRYRQILAIVGVFSAMSTVGIVIGGEALIRLVYGQKFAGSGVILAWLACANAYRNLRVAPSLVALARGDSQNQMISNLWRVFSLIPTFGLALMRQPVWMLACCGLLGELLACWASLKRLRDRDRVPWSDSFFPTLLLSALVAVAGLVAWAGAHEWRAIWALPIAILASLLSGAIMAYGLPELRREARSVWDGFYVGGVREAFWRLSGQPARKVAARLI